MHAENQRMQRAAHNILAEGHYIATGVAGILNFCRHNADGATVLLDRDGVLNRRIIGGYVTHWREFGWLPSVLQSLRRLTDAGFQPVIISNQAQVAGDGCWVKKPGVRKSKSLGNIEIARGMPQAKHDQLAFKLN